MWVRLARGISAACPSQVHRDLAKPAHRAWAHGVSMQRRKAYVASGVSHSSCELDPAQAGVASETTALPHGLADRLD